MASGDHAGRNEVLWGMGEDIVVMTGAWPRDKLPRASAFFPFHPIGRFQRGTVAPF